MLKEQQQNLTYTFFLPSNIPLQKVAKCENNVSHTSSYTSTGIH